MLQDPLMNTFFSLILVVGALAGLLFLVKRFAIRQRKMKPDGMGLEVVSRISLQPKTHLFIVKAGKKKLLIGANDHSINTLADLTEYKQQVENPATKTVLREPLNQTITGGIPKRQQTEKGKILSLPNDESINPLSFKKFLSQAFRRQ